MSPWQYAVGKDKRIQHGISLARDAIFAVSKSKKEAGIADLDFQAAFDLLCVEWVLKVLEKKGLDKKSINRINRIYNRGITIPVINNIPGEKIMNTRMTLRQGDCPSSIWFA